jgi:predicted nucleic acid-binding protein
LLQDFLSAGEVATHPFVIGELACGNLSKRGEVLALLSELPLVTMATNEEVLHLIDRHKLNGKGLGWIDMNLLASALISRIPLWTRDRRLAAEAKTLGITEHK